MRVYEWACVKRREKIFIRYTKHTHKYWDRFWKCNFPVFLQVLAQIDKLTAYIDLDPEENTEDDKTLTCNRNSSERALENLSNVEAYSNSNGLTHLLHNSLCDSAKIAPALYRRSCGDLPALNGPTWPNASWLFGRREEIHSCDSVELHALCCDDDEFDEENGGRRSSRFSSSDSVFSSSPLQPVRLGALTPRSVRKYHLSPGLKKKTLRSCSTQTVSDKSTQTALTHSPARQRSASEHKH